MDGAAGARHPVRGPAPDKIGVDPEPGRLRAWNLENVHDYWRSWAERALTGTAPNHPLIGVADADRL
ncbi:hypothetical protein [Streptomyces halobius]|uniref:Uncharacterized protein n=1 Tax=Streptomyces halobius TaxID=2879846 RepID=A0ABY4MLK1_9ACTN|nr:hypothetical protein [Streptomyces halobius]UQA97301.1 hypothetical protein K9S39_40430 [Streptomyces halobius]